MGNINCLEQYIMVEKARNFGDQQAVVRITKESNPVKQKQIGKIVRGFHKQDWEEVAEEKILPGMLAKFTQNETCRDVLLDTGDNLLIEGNPHDLFFGACVPLHSPDMWQPSKYKGKKHYGKNPTTREEANEKSTRGQNGVPRNTRQFHIQQCMTGMLLSQ